MLRLNERKLILLFIFLENSEILELQSLLGERAFSNFLCKLKSSRADGTVRNYLRCFNDYSKFCECRNLPAIPVRSAYLAAYLSTKTDVVNSATSVEVYRAGVLWVSALITNSNDASGPWDRAVVASARRCLKQTGSRKAPAISIVFLQQVQKFCFLRPYSLLNLRIGALCSLAFYSCCRISELLSLRVQDVIFELLGFKIFLRHSKTDQFRHGNEICIASVSASKQFFCPVKNMRLYLDLLEAEAGSPLFPSFTAGRTGRLKALRRPLSVQNSYRELGRVLEAVHIPVHFTWHSFRSGGISRALEAGACVDDAKAHGRWKTQNAFERYIARSPEKRYSVTSSMT